MACKCFYLSHTDCDLVCPDGQDFNPSQECTCEDADTIKAEYPEWTTPEQIVLAYDNGKANWTKNTAAVAAAADGTADTGADTAADGRPDVWPACDAAITCTSDFYLNKLTCACFIQAHCSDAGCAADQDLLPTAACECAAKTDIRALYPSWSTVEDVERSVTEGLEEAAALIANIPNPPNAPTLVSVSEDKTTIVIEWTDV